MPGPPARRRLPHHPVTPHPVPPGYFRISPDDGRLCWTGRVLFSEGVARFDWPGVSLAFRFRGGAFALELADGNNDYDLVLDGDPLDPWRTRAGETLRIFEGLREGRHEFRLAKRTEASYGEASFRGLLLPEGASLLEPPPRPGRRIEFIGDSLVCGYGVEGNNPLCPGCRRLENVHRSYAGLAAAELGAEARYIAWSGKGVVRNYGDPGERGSETIPAIYERLLAGRPGPVNDFAAWTPHLVVLQCGSNDFTTEPQANPESWIETYSGFALRALSRYSNARLLCASSLDLFKGCIEEAVGRIRLRSGQTVPLVQWGKRNIRELGCDYHPNVRAQRGMADRFIPAVRELMGW